MSRNGAGTYNLPSGNPVVTNTTISSTWANSTLSDIASALTQSVAKDGQTVMTNNLPMGGFKLTNLGAGTNAGDSVSYQQLFSQGLPIDIASAATVDIGGQNTTFLNVTGSVGITSFGTNYNGPRILKFSAALTITHNSTSLVLPNSTNITTKSGDYAIFVPKSTVSQNPDGWALVSYINSDGNVYVKDQAYDDLEWNGNLSVPTKNAVRDKIEAVIAGLPALETTASDPTYASTSSTKAATPQWITGYSNKTNLGSPSQSYQELTGSRALNTGYTNSTGRPIFLSISITQGGSGAGGIAVNGGIVAWCSPSVTGGLTYVSAIVPAGQSYSYNITAGSQSIFSWWEYR